MIRDDYVSMLRSAYNSQFGVKHFFETNADARFVALKLRNIKRARWFNRMPDARELREVSIRRPRPNEVWLIPGNVFARFDDTREAIGESRLELSELRETDASHRFRRGSAPRSRSDSVFAFPLNTRRHSHTR